MTDSEKHRGSIYRMNIIRFIEDNLQDIGIEVEGTKFGILPPGKTEFVEIERFEALAYYLLACFRLDPHGKAMMLLGFKVVKLPNVKKMEKVRFLVEVMEVDDRINLKVTSLFSEAVTELKIKEAERCFNQLEKDIWWLMRVIIALAHRIAGEMDLEFTDRSGEKKEKR